MNAVLQAILGLNTGPFKAGIRDADGSARGLQSTLRSVGQSLGVAFSIAGAMAAARSVATWASGISEAAQNVGILSSEMLALNGIAETNGIKVEDLAKMLAKLQTQQMDAAKGSDTARAAFDGLGLSLDAVMRMDPVELLQAVATAAMETGTPVTALADIFGDKLGPKAVAALRQISVEGLGPLNDDLGKTIDEIERMDDTWTSFMSTVKGNLATSFNWVIDQFKNASDFWGGMLAGGGNAYGKGMQQAVENIRQAEEEKISTRRQKQAQRAADRKAAADARVAQLATTETASKTKAGEDAATAQKAIDNRIKHERDANMRMRIDLMDGEAKIRAQYNADQQAAGEAMAAAKSQAEKDLITERMGLIDQGLARELAAIHKAADEKRKTAAENAQKLSQQLTDKRGDLDKIGGRGVNANALEQMGAGGFGVDRSGFGAADRVFRVQQEQATHLAEIERLTAELLQATLDDTGGGI